MLFRSRASGLHFIPEERLGRGAVPTLSLAQNVLLTRTETLGPLGTLRPKALAAQALDIMSRYGVKASGPQASARSLSGGNLQKFLVGREVSRAPCVLVLNQPTWGVDAAASADIRQRLIDLARQGSAVLVISQDLDELFEIADRIAVIHQGKVSAPRLTRDVTREDIGLLMAAAPAGADGALHAH